MRDVNLAEEWGLRASVVCHIYLFLSDLQDKHDAAEKSSLPYANMAVSHQPGTFTDYLGRTVRKNDPTPPPKRHSLIRGIAELDAPKWLYVPTIHRDLQIRHISL